MRKEPKSLVKIGDEPLNTNRQNVEPFLPHERENKLKSIIREAAKQKDYTTVKQAQKSLVKLYVLFGEHFKMSDKPDPRIAEYFLKKAVSLQKDHPIANYRLAHLLYRREDYVGAVTHFERALAGSEGEGLNESQEMLANMFMANCGIYITRHALNEIEAMEDNPYIQLDDQLVAKYRPEMEVTDEKMLNRMYYRKITPEGEQTIKDDQLLCVLNEQPKNQVILRVLDDGKKLFYKNHDPIDLEPTSFYILYSILRANHPVTGQDIMKKIYDVLEEEISHDTIRQTFSRLQRRIPFWDEIIQSVQVFHHETNRRRTARTRAEGITYCIICRAGDVMLDDKI
jgi:hypothetical protein